MQTGVDIVAAPDAGVIFLDPALSRDDAIAALRRTMPELPLIEVIRAVEESLPPPEGRVLINRDALQGRGRWSKLRLTSAVTASGAFVVTLLIVPIARYPSQDPMHV